MSTESYVNRCVHTCVDSCINTHGHTLLEFVGLLDLRAGLHRRRTAGVHRRLDGLHALQVVGESADGIVMLISNTINFDIDG